jgi:hypothetical protein
MFGYYLIILALVAAVLSVGAITVLVLASPVYGFFQQMQLKARYGNRPPLTREDFILFLQEKGFIATDTGNLYDEIRKHIPPQITLYPSDNLHRDYGLDVDFLENITLKIFRLRHQRSPDPAENKRLAKEKPMDTFEKILQFVALRY